MGIPFKKTVNDYYGYDQIERDVIDFRIRMGLPGAYALEKAKCAISPKLLESRNLMT